MDHALPLACLLLEYIVCSNPPFLRRQYPLMFLIAVVYLSINCIATLTDKPVYPPMTWRGPLGAVVPIALVMGATLIFFALEFVSKKRFIRSG